MGWGVSWCRHTRWLVSGIYRVGIGRNDGGETNDIPACLNVSISLLHPTTTASEVSKHTLAVPYAAPTDENIIAAAL